MSAMQRNKGKAGEREIAAIVRDLTGWDVRRRVRQHDGDSDLEGAPGWSVEVKRHRSATRGDLARWWAQAVAQAGDQVPVLFYRLDRDTWRAVWPVAVLLVLQRAVWWRDYEWTADTTVQAWASAARDALPGRTAEAAASPQSADRQQLGASAQGDPVRHGDGRPGHHGIHADPDWPAKYARKYARERRRLLCFVRARTLRNRGVFDMVKQQGQMMAAVQKLSRRVKRMEAAAA